MSENIFQLAFTITPPGLITGGPSTPAALIDNVLRFGMYAIGVIGVVMMVYSGFLYVISVGRPERTKQALNSIIYTAVGFAIAILARSFVEFFAGNSNLNICQSGNNIAQVCKGVPALISDGISTFLWVIGIAAVIVMIVSGLMYVTSAGDPGRSKSAKDAILYAAVGLAVAILGGGIIQFVGRIFGL